AQEPAIASAAAEPEAGEPGPAAGPEAAEPNPADEQDPAVESPAGERDRSEAAEVTSPPSRSTGGAE
ncbi:MAG: hypothetical protein WAP37_05290, partial [Solirubrobacterales bacterium]